MWIKSKKILSKIENIEIIGNQLSVNGEFYACKPDIFEITYESAE